MWLKDSSEKCVVLGHVLTFLYCSMVLIKSSNFVSGNSCWIILAIVSLSLFNTKSNPFWIAFVNFLITSLLFSIKLIRALYEVYGIIPPKLPRDATI